MMEQIMVFNLPRTSEGAKSKLLTMLLWRKEFSTTKIVLFLKKRKEKCCSNKRKCAKEKQISSILFIVLEYKYVFPTTLTLT